MRWSRYFLPTMKDTPAEAQIASHRYMLRAGMVRQNAAGEVGWVIQVAGVWGESESSIPEGHAVRLAVEESAARHR